MDVKGQQEEQGLEELATEDSPQRRQTITQDFIPSPGPTSSKSTFPVSRVKAIMRQDQDVQLVSGDAVYAMAVAAEAFLEILAKEAYSFTKAESRKTVQYKDLAKAVESVVAFEFLEGARMTFYIVLWQWNTAAETKLALTDIVPKPVPVKQALRNKN